jgi:hypothetical protein
MRTVDPERKFERSLMTEPALGRPPAFQFKVRERRRTS